MCVVHLLVHCICAFARRLVISVYESVVAHGYSCSTGIANLQRATRLDHKCSVISSHTLPAGSKMCADLFCYKRSSLVFARPSPRGLCTALTGRGSKLGGLSMAETHRLVSNPALAPSKPSPGPCRFFEAPRHLQTKHCRPAGRTQTPKAGQCCAEMHPSPYAGGPAEHQTASQSTAPSSCSPRVGSCGSEPAACPAAARQLTGQHQAHPQRLTGSERAAAMAAARTRRCTLCPSCREV